MFAHCYFGGRYFAPTYWAQSQGEPGTVISARRLRALRASRTRTAIPASED